MKSVKIILTIVFIMFTISCSEDNPIRSSFGNEKLIDNIYKFTDYQKSRMNGVYTIISGKERFGEKIIAKWVGDSLTLFTGKDYATFILACGLKDSTWIFEGTLKNAFSNDIFISRLYIQYNEGGKELLAGNDSSFKIIFRGKTGSSAKNLTNDIEFELRKNIDFAKDTFAVLAHRGGSSSYKGIPEAENSLSMIRLAEKYGANGIEIDIHLTKDKVPILFHDENLSERTVNGQFFIGPISNFAYSHIKSFCTLKNGEVIPTLKEALDEVVNNTKLKIVWLDIKSEETIDSVLPVQIEYMRRAKNMGRELTIFLGLALDETYNRFQNNPLHYKSNSVCELNFDKVLNSNSDAWAPRWTLGTLSGEIDKMHSKGKKVFFWTIDLPESLNIFLQDDKTDGILTNYPSMVFYEYFTRKYK